MLVDHADNRHASGESFFALEEIQGVDRITLRCSGDLDVETATRVEDYARRLIDRGCGALTFDLSEVTFMDCRGLAVLLELEQLALEGGWTFDVSHARGPTLRLLELAEVADRLTAA